MQKTLYSQQMKLFYMFAICLLLLTSCDNEIDINAPWVETPVVYGFLDADTNVQFIRIQKTYLNSVDQTTEEGAQFSDSLYFDTIVVTVTGSRGGVFRYFEIPFPKDEGFFTNENSVVYRATGFTPRTDETYRLSIFSPKTGKTYTANSAVIGRGEFPSNIPTSIRYRPADPNNDISFRFNTSPNTMVFDAIFRLKYVEYPKTNPANRVIKHVDYVIAQSEELNTGNVFVRFYSMKKALRAMASELTADNAVERRITSLDYLFFSGTSDLKLLIDVSKPTQSIVQVKPEYSNIDGGLGIFTGRTESNRYAIPIAGDSTYIYMSMELPNFVY